MEDLTVKNPCLQSRKIEDHYGEPVQRQGMLLSASTLVPYCSKTKQLSPSKLRPVFKKKELSRVSMLLPSIKSSSDIFKEFRAMQVEKQRLDPLNMKLKHRRTMQDKSFYHKQKLAKLKSVEEQVPVSHYDQHKSMLTILKAKMTIGEEQRADHLLNEQKLKLKVKDFVQEHRHSSIEVACSKKEYKEVSDFDYDKYKRGQFVTFKAGHPKQREVSLNQNLSDDDLVTIQWTDALKENLLRHQPNHQHPLLSFEAQDSPQKGLLDNWG